MARPVRKAKSSRSHGKRARPARKSTRSPPTKGARFVGRDASPVLDHYPPKDPGFGVPPPSVSSPLSTTARALPSSPPPTDHSPPPPVNLISLDRPFDLDEFSQTLGENSIRVTVPREDLTEVLRRITDFMGFGIYVYRFSVRPAPSDLLKQFVIELERVDYSAAERDWVPFEEKGRSDSPFGPGSSR